MKISKTLISLIAVTFISIPAFGNQAQLNYVEQEAARGIPALKNSMDKASNRWAELHYENLTEYVMNEIKHPYYSALAHLLIAEVLTNHYPEISRQTSPHVYWFLPVTAKDNLEEVLRQADVIELYDHANKYGFIADIAFFTHLAYDKLRHNTQIITDRLFRRYRDSFPGFSQRPAKEFFDLGRNAIEMAIANEKYSQANRSLRKGSSKSYLYPMVKARYLQVSVDNIFGLPLAEVPSNQQHSLAAYSYAAYEASQIKFTETRAFMFFDFLGGLFIPKYGLAKKTLQLINTFIS